VRARFLLVSAMIAAAFMLAGCNREDAQFREGARLSGGGDARAGKVAIRHYGCQGCHSIPGIEGANGVVGPPLTNMAQRVYLAGTLPNTSENLRKWIQKPQEVLPNNAMPDMNVSDQDSKDIAAYLYSLR
jgi:cytochrome c1